MLGCRPHPGWDGSQPPPPSLLSSWGGPCEAQRQKVPLPHPGLSAAGAKRQHPPGLDGPSAAMQQQNENVDPSQHWHSVAKQQRLDSHSQSQSQAYSASSMPGMPGLVNRPLLPPPQGFMQPAPFNNRTHAPSSSSLVVSTPGRGGGLLPSPRPGILPSPIPHQGSRKPGFAGYPGIPSPASSHSAETVGTNLSLNSGTGASGGNDSSFPENSLSSSEIPAQVEVDRIYSELDCLNKRMDVLKWSTAPELSSSDRPRQIVEVREEMNRLHKQLAKEKQRLDKENMQLNQKLAMQYNLSMDSESSVSSSPHTERKQNHTKSIPTPKAKGKNKKNKNEQTVDNASTSLSVNYSNLSIQIFELDCKIEAMVEGLAEGEGNPHTLQMLRGQRKALKRERACVKNSKSKLENQEKEARFGLDPFQQLKKLARRVRTWRMLRTDTSINRVQDQSSTRYKDDDDVLILDDSDDSDMDTSIPEKRGRYQKGSESKEGRYDKTVRDIEDCMTRRGLTAAGQTSFFALSALSSILLARQKQRQATAAAAAAAAQLSTISVPSSTIEPPPCPLNCLTRELAQKLDLAVEVKAGLKHGEMADLYRRSKASTASVGVQKTNAQDTANLYMQMFSQKK